MAVQRLESVEDRNLLEIEPLATPRSLRRELPVGSGVAAVVGGARRAIRSVLSGRDPKRLVVIVGPCSIHDPEAALEYAAKLRSVAEPVKSELIVAMRTYFEKPRTGMGWKGFINDPRLDGSCDVSLGLTLARRLLLAIGELGIPCASEVLDPFTPQFTGDLLSWASIGARTSESQTHRQLASGLPMPVGFKNGTNGGLEGAVNAMLAAGHSHAFPGISAEGEAALVRTRGNPDRHLILRGGGGRTNFDANSIAAAARAAGSQGIARPVMVDCSHANSNRDHSRQAPVCREVLRGVRDGGAGPLMGLLLESHLQSGAQPWEIGATPERGRSITDACMGWNETEDLLYEIAEAVKVSY